MTIDEVSKRHNIPIDVLQKYENMGIVKDGKKVTGAWNYDEDDIQRLSMIMTLKDIGFDNNEVEQYMHLLEEGCSTNEYRLDMLNKRRTDALNEIHFKEAQIDKLDYLRHKIKSRKF